MPNLATVIPAMDHIDKVPATSPDSPYRFSPAICVAFTVGKNANRCYNKTDKSEVYRIAMGMIFIVFTRSSYPYCVLSSPPSS